jgi:hypothetical protein
MRFPPYVLVLTALGLIALGGFLITVYGKARYDAGVADGKIQCVQEAENAKQKEKKQHEKRKKQNYKLVGDDLVNAYCEWVLSKYPRDKCLREVRFFD